MNHPVRCTCEVAARISSAIRAIAISPSIRISRAFPSDRKSTRLNSSHTVIYTLSLHDALPIYEPSGQVHVRGRRADLVGHSRHRDLAVDQDLESVPVRSEEHTSELQSHSDLHSFPTRRSSDL